MTPKRKDTGKNEVRWREGGKNRSRSFDRKKDADDFKAQLRINKQRRGMVTIDAGGSSIADLGVEVYKMRWSNLAPKTRKSYALIWDVHVIKRIGGKDLQMLTPYDVEAWVSKMEKDGVGRESQRRALKLLKYALDCAVHWRMVEVNVALSAPIPGKPAKRPISPATPEQAEAVRAELLAAGRPLDALRVSIMYAQGLRVGETTRTEWDHFKERTVLVHDTKRNTWRAVDLEPEIVKEVAEVKLITPESNAGLVFQGDGNNWRNRVFDPAAEDAKVQICPPKDLRHTRVSMLLMAHESIPYIAEQLGHGPDMTLKNYSHMIRELRGSERIPANDLIVRARYAALKSKGLQSA